MKLWRYSGLLLIITAVFHTLVGLILGWDMLLDISSEGVWNTVAVPIAAGAEHSRAELVWFLMLGFTWIMLGFRFHTDIKSQQRPLSQVWGWCLFSQGVAVAVVLPQSGAWLLIPQGIIILLASKNNVPG